MKHAVNCNWIKSNCEFKDTHEYCPHPEHKCDCDGNIEHLVTGSTDLTPELALKDSLNFDFSSVLICGYQDGEFVTRSSHMSRKDVLWLLNDAIDYCRGNK